MPKKHLAIKIYGLVQGVFFRHSAKIKVQELGLAGWARNEPDGTLHVEAEGEEAALQKFLDWCREGPPLARVEKVKFTFSDTIKNK